jgi:hypothetical protein
VSMLHAACLDGIIIIFVGLYNQCFIIIARLSLDSIKTIGLQSKYNHGNTYLFISFHQTGKGSPSGFFHPPKQYFIKDREQQPSTHNFTCPLDQCIYIAWWWRPCGPLF